MNDIDPAAVAQELMQAPLMGSFIALLLYGITCIQAFFYFQTYTDDHPAIKCMVFTLWTLETIHSGLNISFINHYLIDNFGNVAALNTIAWDLLAGFEIGFVIGLIVNSYFTWRIWRFTQSLWATSILILLTISRFALSTTAMVYGCIYSASWEVYKQHAHVLLLVLISLGILGDTVAATILAYHLHEGRSGLRRTDRLINRLLAYTVATGGFTALLDCLALISVLASPNTILFLAFVHILMKVYANSALMSLNLRRYQSKVLGDPVNVALSDFRVATLSGIEVVRETPDPSKSPIGQHPESDIRM